VLEQAVMGLNGTLSNFNDWRREMKVMAIGAFKPLSQEQRQQYLPKEVRATLQFYLTARWLKYWRKVCMIANNQ
jgi:hypothetical protein